MIDKEVKYSYNDLTIKPSITTSIKHRSECNCFVDDDNNLPIFASPMTSVVNEDNYEIFKENGITPIIPRSVSLEKRIDIMSEANWVAMSLKEFEDLFIKNSNESLNKFGCTYKVCIDIANGHMSHLYSLCVRAKRKALDIGYDLCIMIGNIANPKTYKYIMESVEYATKSGYRVPAIDYVRVGIGGGAGCTTTSNVGVHYPQASLIDECYTYRKHYCGNNYPKIIADGGIRNYNDVIKALALGADYVMIGSVFAQCVESAGMKTTRSGESKTLPFPMKRYKSFTIHNGYVKGFYTDEFIEKMSESWKKLYDETKEFGPDDPRYAAAYMKYHERLDDLSQEKNIGRMDVVFFGMASADGQKAISGEKTKTAEGITKRLPVKWTLSQWTENMIAYLRSAMSYTDHNFLSDFIGGVVLVVNSPQEIQAINK